MRSLLLAAAAACALVAPAAAHADAASDIADRYIAWRGGDAFARARGLRLVGTTDDGRFTGRFERRAEPGRTLERFNIGAARTERAFIGAGGWSVTLSGQVENADAAAARQAGRQRALLFDDALRGRGEGRGGRLTLEPDETLDGKPVRVLRVTYDAATRFDYLLDPDTAALVADRDTSDGETRVTRYDDWRMIEGVKVAFKATEQVQGDPLRVTLTVAEADIDPRPDGKAFARPAPRKLYAFVDGQRATPPLPFEFYLGSRINIPAAVNGHATEVLLDSGAEATVLDKAYAESLGIRPSAQVSAVGTGGREPAELASGVTVRIGALELRDMTVALLDLKPIAAAIGRPLPVILGKEVLNALTVDLDFQAKTIAFRDPEGYRPPPGAVAVPVSNANGLHAIPARIEGGPTVLMDFDLGNGSPLLVYPSYWKPRDMLKGRATSKGVSGAVGGLKQRDVATVTSLTLAGVTFHDLPGIFGEEDGSAFATTKTMGNIGLPVLSRFALTTDYARQRILLTPVKDAVDRPFPKDRTGVTARAGKDGLVIVFVAPGSPGEAAGLKAGQIITAVNGKPAGDVGQAGFTTLRTGKAGDTLTLQVAGAEPVSVVLKDYF